MIFPKCIAGLFLSFSILFIAIVFLPLGVTAQAGREKISINNSWHFFKGDPADAKGIFYELRPKVADRNDNVVADTRANQSNTLSSDNGLKKWILPAAIKIFYNR